MKADWGFCCFIETSTKNILFDTGMKPEILEGNFKTMGVDPKDIDTVVISHWHEDHYGGLPWVVEQNGDIELLLPDKMSDWNFGLYKDKVHFV